MFITISRTDAERRDLFTTLDGKSQARDQSFRDNQQRDRQIAEAATGVQWERPVRLPENTGCLVVDDLSSEIGQ